MIASDGHGSGKVEREPSARLSRRPRGGMTVAPRAAHRRDRRDLRTDAGLVGAAVSRANLVTETETETGAHAEARRDLPGHAAALARGWAALGFGAGRSCWVSCEMSSLPSQLDAEKPEARAQQQPTASTTIVHGALHRLRRC